MKKKIIIIITLFMLILTPFLIKNNEIVKAETSEKYKFVYGTYTTRPTYTQASTYSRRRFSYDGTNTTYTDTTKAMGYAINENITIYHMASTYDRQYYDTNDDAIYNEFIIINNGTPYRLDVYINHTNNEITTFTSNQVALNAMGLTSAEQITEFEFTKINFETRKANMGEWFNIFFAPLFQDIENQIQLETPVLTLNLNTLHWQEIENAEYYNIYKDGDLIGQTQNTQWITIENGIYTIQACTTNIEEYTNSNISNAITQTNYNDMIGNGVNWFTLMSAIIDSQIYLMKSLLNYTIWDINFFQLFTFVITIIITLAIIKFIKGW